jgi:hypothetical protein
MIKFMGADIDKVMYKGADITSALHNSNDLYQTLFLISIGIDPDNIAFFQSYRKGTSQGGTITVRRSSDGETATFSVGPNGLPEAEMVAFGGSDQLYVSEVSGQSDRTYEGMLDPYFVRDFLKTYSTVVGDTFDTISVTNYNPAHEVPFFNGPFKENTQYTLEYRIKDDASESPLFFRMFHTDGSYKQIYGFHNDWYDATLSSDSGKTLDRIEFSFGVGSAIVDLDLTAIKLYEKDTLPELNTGNTVSEQPTAANQPKLYDNRIFYGLGQFDRTNDYLEADLPDITDGPCTWWARFKGRGISSGFLFSKAGNGHTEAQYGLYYYVSGPSLIFNKQDSFAPQVSIQTEDTTKEIIFAVTWDGSVISSFAVIEGELHLGLTNTFTGPLTSWPNSFVGAESASSDGEEIQLGFDGDIYELGIVKQALTQQQIEALW